MTKKPDAVDVEIGMRIRARRNAARMSQTTLAEGLGLTFQQVQKYEKGSNRIGGSRITQIAALLGCTVADLFGTKPGKANEAGDETIVLKLLCDKTNRAAVLAYAGLTPRQQQAVAGLLTAMAA